jgi:hypothetical protein
MPRLPDREPFSHTPRSSWLLHNLFRLDPAGLTAIGDFGSPVAEENVPFLNEHHWLATSGTNRNPGWAVASSIFLSYHGGAPLLGYPLGNLLTIWLIWQCGVIANPLSSGKGRRYTEPAPSPS